MARPLIALLTDFGLRDHYAGTMKGVMLGICPDATLVDISHEIPAHDVLAGALELAAAFRYFPSDTIFLVVVDPGVGSMRQAIAVEAGGYRFVAPNNGVLSVVLDDCPAVRAVELTEPRYQLATVSRTFEGRDRFAPAAAWLAAGTMLEALGAPVTTVHRLQIPKPAVDAEGIHGEVLRVDRFGNLISNIDWKTFERCGRVDGLQVGEHRVAHVVATYAEVADGEVCALFGSTGHLEFAVNGASAAARLALGRGAPVHVAAHA